MAGTQAWVRYCSGVPAQTMSTAARQTAARVVQDRWRSLHNCAKGLIR